MKLLWILYKHIIKGTPYSLSRLNIRSETMDQEIEINYTKLNAIDGKTGGLLQITSILLVFASLPLMLGEIQDIQKTFLQVFMIVFLISGLFSLFSMWFSEFPSKRLVQIRVIAHNLTVLLTATGLAGACTVMLAF